MAALDDLAAYLQSEGHGTVSTTIFKSRLPDTPPTETAAPVIGLIPVPGLPPVHVHSQALPSYEQPVVQVVILGAPGQWAAAETKAYAVWRSLVQVTNQTLSGTFYLWIQALQSPFKLRTDEYRRDTLIFHVRLAKAL